MKKLTEKINDEWGKIKRDVDYSLNVERSMLYPALGMVFLMGGLLSGALYERSQAELPVERPVIEYQDYRE